MTENEREGNGVAGLRPSHPLGAQHTGSVSDLLELFRGQSSGGGGGDGMRRNDSEIAFQDFLKRIPSSSNLAYLSSGGPSMGNLLDAATGGGGGNKEGLQGAGSEQGAVQPQAGGSQQKEQQQNGGGMKPSGLMSGMPRVSSLDFLARLVCSQPLPASGSNASAAQQLPPPQGTLPSNGTITTSSGTPGAPGIKLEPGTTGLHQESFAGAAPAPLTIPGMNPIDLQGLPFSSGLNPAAGLQGMPHHTAHSSIPPPLSQGLHLPGSTSTGIPGLSPSLQIPSNTSNNLSGLPQGGLHIPNISGLNNTMQGLPPGAGLDLGPLNHLNNIHFPQPQHHAPSNPTQAATAALQLQGQLAQAGSTPTGPLLHHSLDTSAHTPQQPQPQPQPQPQQQATGKRGRQRQQPAAQQSARGGAQGAASSARASSRPSSTADTGTMSDESDGADNLKGAKGGPNNKRARRMLSNRESARRSRKRKQEHLGKLEDQINALQEGKRQLQESNALLNQQFASVSDHNRRLQTENERLRDEVNFLRAEVQGQHRDGKQ